MQLWRRCDDACLVVQNSPLAEVELLSRGVRHDASSLAHDDRTSRVVPDPLLVAQVWKSHERGGFPRGDNAVLHLGVQPDRLDFDPAGLRNFPRKGVVAVQGLHRFHVNRLRRLQPTFAKTEKLSI